jgi:sugar/nucleoside kinase (ribokinase family)
VKQGAKGCTLFDSHGTRQIPAMKAVVVDTTGAGDSFDAGFVAALAEDRSAHEAAEHAIRIAARRVSVVGGSGKL